MVNNKQNIPVKEQYFMFSHDAFVFQIFFLQVLNVQYTFAGTPTQIDARDVKLAMGGQYNFIPIFYFFDIQAPISIRNFSGNKIFFKISPQE